nr:MAG TPA: PGRP protein [Bacteriophage sp.]
MSNQFKCDVDVYTTADSGARDPHKCQLGVFHTTENDDVTDPVSVARWQQNRANGSSYNILVGTDGKTVRSNDDNYIPWAAGTTGNRVGLHASAIGRASRGRGAWTNHPKQLESLARWAADLHTRYGLPLVWLTAEQVRAGARGFCGHAEVSAAWREVDHTDPGAGFPHDIVLGRAREIATGALAKKDEQMTPNYEKLIFEQLTGPGDDFRGWAQLGGRTLVDALAAIGEKLGVEGFKAPE